MSNVNIKRAVENIRANTTIYTPIVEMVVNAIQAIDETGRTDGRVLIRVVRGSQSTLDGLPDVTGFEIEDDGVGFTDAHRDSFDTLFSDLKLHDGGKGFGRFTCLKYFEDLHVTSVFQVSGQFKQRTFSMGKDHDIIVNERVDNCQHRVTGTVVTLGNMKKGRSIDKTLPTIARNIVEKLLPYFITQEYTCPEVFLAEEDGSGTILLNDFVGNKRFAEIQELGLDRNTITLLALDTKEEFAVRVFKFYSPRNQKSRISLVAHKREVSGSPLHKYVPEFEDEFYEKHRSGDLDRERNYIIKAYVFGSYLDRNVSLERGGFEFQMEADIILGIPQVAIEREAASIARASVGDDIAFRQERKKERVQSYVEEEAPWHKEILRGLDLGGMSFHATTEEIELRLQKEKFAQERQIKKEVVSLLEAGDFQDVQEKALEIVSRISDASRNDLAHYIALRRTILDILEKSLQVNDRGSYASEGAVHDIIFPRKGNSDVTPFNGHNLWIIDERLNFTTHVSSDTPLYGKNTDRPDLIVYNKRVLFRGDNESSNPITIFEFKKPQRDDFVNPSSQEDPVQQIVRYVNDIRDGKFTTPQGRRILVGENTPFYGYVVCDLTPKVETWLQREKDFKPMPDRLGWFHWMGNNNLYLEVISWEKVLKDAKMRNKIFFEKLGI